MGFLLCLFLVGIFQCVDLSTALWPCTAFERLVGDTTASLSLASYYDFAFLQSRKFPLVSAASDFAPLVLLVCLA